MKADLSLSTTRERQLRHTEALLLLLVLLILASGAWLVLMAKQGAVLASGETVNINTASSDLLAKTLEISPDAAGKLAEERQRRRGFQDVDSLASWSELLPRAKLLKAYRELTVRSWEEARKTFLICCGLLAGWLLPAHLLLRRFRPRSDPFLLPLAALLAVLGVLLLFAIKDPVRDRLSFVGQTVGVLGGGVLALFIPLSGLWGRLPLHRYGYVYALTAVGLTAVLWLLGSGPGGVRLSVGGVQPVEGIKIFMALFLAAYLADRASLLEDRLRRWGPFPLLHRQDVLPLLVLYALPLVLFAIVRDLGPALLLFGVFLAMVYLATGRGLYVWLGALLLGLGGYLGYLLKLGVFRTRVDMWLSPWNNSHSSGEHLVLGWWGLASGGPFGSGLGLGGSRYIPRAGSDLAFAALGEEAGLCATLAVLACFVVLTARGLAIARRSAKDFDRYVAAGLTLLLALQALILVAGTLGLMPLAGITLPFVSYGKSSLIASFVIIGVLLALSDRSGGAVGAPEGFRLSANRVLGYFVLTLGCLCTLRLIYLQLLFAWPTAARTVTTPDADTVRRSHRNPRLLALANRLRRGSLLDRKGRILAQTRNARRVYPYGEALGHLIGYADPAVGGPSGLEATFAPELRGFQTWSDLVRVWQAKDLPGYRLPEGKDVVLTLDAELQKAALASLRAQAGRLRDRRSGRVKNRGAVVVLDIATGGVLAAVTSPTFDPNTLTPAVLRRLNTDVEGEFPLINRALGGYYPPGSTFKMVTATSLLTHGQGGFTTTCNHIASRLVWKGDGRSFARRRVVDDESDRSHGRVALTEAVAESCNIYFARAGIALGAEDLRETVTAYGFSKIPSPPIFLQELPDIAYGQGPMLVTPLEMAGVAQTIAGGGVRLTPQFRKDAAPKSAGRVLEAEAAARLKEAMREVTMTGTAAGKFARLPVTVAGKTGTAQNDRYDRMSHSWFIGFAPAEQPRVAFAVLVENGGYGAAVAVPIARETLARIDWNEASPSP